MIQRIFMTSIACVVMGYGPACSAQDPIVRIDLPESSAIPGQPLQLRVTVLVPTWMPKPVAFPSFEAPNVMVRLPERATNPISERVNSDTWAGVTRRYVLLPLAPGQVSIQAQDIIVTWSDPETNQPLTANFPVPALTIEGIIPDAAKGLDPFIAASSLTLSQTFQGLKETLLAGETVIREVEATIEGAPAILLPNLIEPEPIDGVAIYPSEPVVEETYNRSKLSGRRLESVTYVAQSGGAGEAAAVTINWYNLESGEVETARVSSASFVVDAPIARDAPPINPVTIIGFILASALLLIAALLGKRFVWPRWQNLREARHARYLASEAFAKHSLLRAIKNRDLVATRSNLNLWAERLPGSDPRCDGNITAALEAIGRSRYGLTGDKSRDHAQWLELHLAVSRFHASRASDFSYNSLPPLNPISMSNRRL